MTDESSVRAVHLAAGQGSRLRPLTNDRPKPLVELGGQSLLERNVDTLRAAGVDDQLVVTGYEADQIRELGFQTVHNDVYDQTEMIYSLFCAAKSFPEAGDGDLLISYGDIVYEKAVVTELLDSDAPVSVVVDRKWRTLWEERFEDPLSDAETLDFDADGGIHEIGGEPDGYDEIDAQYIGLIKVRNDHLEQFVAMYEQLAEDAEGYVSIDATAFLQQLVDNGWHLQAVPVDGGWVEVDTLDDLNRYRELYGGDELPQFVSLYD